MNYKDPGYNRLLVGDLYHWESDQEGYLIIEENSQKTAVVGGDQD